ncbi:MAG TPA: ABC transporter ATP-binding protein [Gemmatimonadaceae bacterium]|nr:ABC transporter ATP-binding protein [Gemmatimonadaceae bacterium]
MSGATPHLVLDRLTRRFSGARAAVDAVSLEIAAGELVALIGASGSGKTTTLRMVAGYEVPDAGAVVLDGRDITGLPPQRRQFGMVFQHYALFPHLTVGQNVAFGLEARGIARSERMSRAADALAGVGLAGADGRAVQSLSGGEQQRVALARALVIEPPVLLLDEPLSNLDPTLRRNTREELRATLRRLGVTALFVTHDQEDAFAVADRVALLAAGRLLQVGTAEELYDRPSNREVAAFIGRSTLVPGALDGDHIIVQLGGAARTLRAAPAPDLPSRGPATAVLRPDALGFSPPNGTDAWPGVVQERRFAGALLAYRVRVAGDVDLELHSTVRDVQPGDAVWVRVTREPVAVVA